LTDTIRIYASLDVQSFDGVTQA